MIVLLLLSTFKKTCRSSTPPMDSTNDLLINEVDGELESVLQQADRCTLGAIDPNTAKSKLGKWVKGRK